MNAVEKKIFHKELMALAVPLALQNLLNALVGANGSAYSTIAVHHNLRRISRRRRQQI